MNARTCITLMCLLVLAAGCGRAVEEVGPAAEKAAQQAARDAPRPPAARPEVPVPRVEPPPADKASVSKRMAEVLRTIPYPNGEQRRAVVKAACGLYTAYKLSRLPDKDELRRQAVLEAGGNLTIALRAIDFLDELRSSSAQDNVGNSAVVAICGL